MVRRLKPTPFRESVPLAELARQQGVAPVERLEDVAKLWPKNDDPDALLRFILEQRRSRRNVNRRRR